MADNPQERPSIAIGLRLVHALDNYIEQFKKLPPKMTLTLSDEGQLEIALEMPNGIEAPKETD